MANVSAVRMTTGTPGIEIVIWYNNANLRIGDVTWTIEPAGILARLRVWDDGRLVIDRTESQGSGAEKVPGNYRMVIDPEFNELTLPANITYIFMTWTV